MQSFQNHDLRRPERDSLLEVPGLVVVYRFLDLPPGLQASEVAFQAADIICFRKEGGDMLPASLFPVVDMVIVEGNRGNQV